MASETPFVGLRKKNHALEAVLSSWEAAELSGSEFSSFATSPIEERAHFDHYFQSPDKQSQEEVDSIQDGDRAGPNQLQPIDLVKRLLARQSDEKATDELLAEDVKIECTSEVASEHRKVHENEAVDSGYTHVHQDLFELQRSCAEYELKVDDIFGIGESVAAFGHFTYTDCPLGNARNVRFSIRAKVDVETARILSFRWQDHIVRADGHGAAL